MATDKHPVQVAPNMSDHEWDDLLYSIEQQKCIVVIGPEVYTAPGEPPMHKRLAAFLEQQASQLRIRVNENGWFHLQPMGTETSPYWKVKEFYNRPTPHADGTLKTLVRIRFPIFISLTPDGKLRQAFDGHAADFETYVRKKPYREDQPVPSAERPLVYQLLGSLEDRNTLVLNYDDFYDYLESVFEKKSMSPILKEAILEADYFLFLGLSFDQWYNHLFMRVLSQSKEKLQTLKVAVPFDAENAESCAEQYIIKFVDDHIGDFVQELFRRCKASPNAGQLLRPLPVFKGELAPHEEADIPLLSELTDLAVENRFEEIYERMKKMLNGSGEEGKKLFVVFIQLKARYTTLEEENSLGILKHEDYSVELNRVRKAFLDQFDEIKRKWQYLNIKI